MPNMTLAIPKDLKDKLERFPEINWSEVARQAFVEKVQLLEHMGALLSKSRLRVGDAIAIGRQIKKRVWRRH